MLDVLLDLAAHLGKTLDEVQAMPLPEVHLWCAKLSRQPFLHKQLNYLFGMLSAIMFNTHADKARDFDEFILWDRPERTVEGFDDSVMEAWGKAMAEEYARIHADKPK